MQPAIFVIGIGNDFHSDEGVGLATIRVLKEQTWPTPVTFKEGVSDGTALLSTWNADSRVILVDAISAQLPPGSIWRYDALTEPLPADLSFHSTHAFGVTETLALADALEQRPLSLLVYGIQGKDFSQGLGLSPEVIQAMWKVVEQIGQDITNWSRAPIMPDENEREQHYA